MDAIRMIGIVKCFGPVRANDGIDLIVGQQEIHCLLGENGTGKSTLMNILFGLYHPDAGEIFINEKKAAIANPNDAYALGIGMVHQHFMLVNQLTVLENIILGKESGGLFLNRKESRKKVEELVIAIDTSESCEGETVKRFLEETYAILSSSESFFHKMNVHIIQCDAAVQMDKRITSKEELAQFMEDFALRGSGGTDFRPVFQYVDKLIAERAFQNLKGLIYFTDGYGTFPKRRPPYDAAFVFYHEDYTDVGVPPWAMKLILGKEDLSLGLPSHGR